MVQFMLWVENDEVPWWRKFKIICPVCQKRNQCRKHRAHERIVSGFGVRNMDGPKCTRCEADLAEPYMGHPYVAPLVAEAKRAEEFRAAAAEYNAAIKTARKGARP